MLSSYARYLGLNAREIVDLFQEDLYVHQTGTASHELRRRTRDTQAGRGISGYDVVNEAGVAPEGLRRVPPAAAHLGGPAGDMGYFATTAPVRSRSSVPLVGSGTQAPVARYVLCLEPRPHARPPSLRRPAQAIQQRPRSASAPARDASRRRTSDRRRRSEDQASRLISEGQRAPERAYDARGQMRTQRL